MKPRVTGNGLSTLNNSFCLTLQLNCYSSQVRLVYIVLPLFGKAVETSVVANYNVANYIFPPKILFFP